MIQICTGICKTGQVTGEAHLPLFAYLARKVGSDRGQSYDSRVYTDVCKLTQYLGRSGSVGPLTAETNRSLKLDLYLLVSYCRYCGECWRLGPFAEQHVGGTSIRG